MVNRIKTKYIIQMLIVLLIPLYILLVLMIFDKSYYRIDLNNVSKKSILSYRATKSKENDVSKFMKHISDGEYETAFDMLDVDNKKRSFHNDVAGFIEQMKAFEDSYTDIKYNTLMSREYKDYTDEEVICILESSAKNTIRFSIRKYKEKKNIRIIILNITQEAIWKKQL